ncbi:hypothetical protein [Wolbachia endosymbiont (group A) of Anomoia purmunda]|uniref:hypothetical protein n=1 Tax=Wolbachia endosymbiont (group A) of Anomoia purmunda TaxID=2953978 RepID=UPI00222F6076|nr:hypothetical protein [Wolbachia endosymbiont (group A) of Anomoia purmunda]
MLTNPVSNQNSWIPVSGHWDDTIIKEPVSATGMTPFFFLDPSSQGTEMTP